MRHFIHTFQQLGAESHMSSSPRIKSGSRVSPLENNIQMCDKFLASAVPVHDALDGVDQGVNLAIVSSKVISLYTPDHGPAQLQAVDPLSLESHALRVVKSKLVNVISHHPAHYDITQYGPL